MDEKKLVARFERLINTPLKQFFSFFLLETFSFFIIQANTRASAHGSYFWTGITEVLFSMQCFAVVKLTFDTPYARTWWAGLGECAGATLGSLLAIWATKHLYGF